MHQVLLNFRNNFFSRKGNLVKINNGKSKKISTMRSYSYFIPIAFFLNSCAPAFIGGMGVRGSCN